MDIARIELFLFDIDGVFLEGKRSPRLLSGTKILRSLRARDLPFRLVTNTSTHSPADVAASLTALGLEIDTGEILSALEVAVAETARRFPGKRCFVVGEQGLRDAAAAAGLEVVSQPPAEVVLVGLSRFTGYQELSLAARCLRDGASLLACHRNKMWIDDDGPALACGPWLAALEYATGAEAEIFGKPTESFYRKAAGAVPHDRVLMIGDDLEADVRGPQLLGMRGGLVLSGKTRRNDLRASGIEPDLVLEEVDDLDSLLPPRREAS